MQRWILRTRAYLLAGTLMLRVRPHLRLLPRLLCLGLEVVRSAHVGLWRVVAGESLPRKVQGRMWLLLVQAALAHPHRLG